MRVLARYMLIVTMSLSLGACRQADGQMPTPDENIQSELEDVRRDLQAIALARDPQAVQDLADDLRKYTESPSAWPAVEELSKRTAAALAGADLSEQPGQRLAHDLWIAVAAFDLSERQVENLQNDVQALLMAEGIAEETAQQVSAQIGDVQGAVNDRSRRWYEVF